MAIKIYQKKYTVVVDPTDHFKGDTKEKRFRISAYCKFWFKGDVLFVAFTKVNNKDYILNDYWYNVADYGGFVFSSKEDLEEYLFSFIGSSEDLGNPTFQTFEDVMSYAVTEGYTLPSVDNQDKLKQFIIDYNTAGIWDDEEAIYMHANDGSEEFGNINLKQAGYKNASDATGGMTWTSKVGYTGDGISGVYSGIDIADALIASVEDMSMSIYLHTIPDTTGINEAYLGFSGDTTSYEFYIKAGTDLMVLRTNSNEIMNSVQDYTPGLRTILVDRSIANPSKYYVNGILKVEDDLAAFVSSNYGTAYFLASGRSTGARNLPSTATTSFGTIGKAQVDKQSMKASIVNAYMSAL